MSQSQPLRSQETIPASGVLRSRLPGGRAAQAAQAGHLQRTGDPDLLTLPPCHTLVTSNSRDGGVLADHLVFFPLRHLHTVTYLLQPCSSHSGWHRETTAPEVGLHSGRSSSGGNSPGVVKPTRSLRGRKLGTLSYLVTVHCILRGPGGDGDGIWLAASIPLAVNILHSIPAGRREKKTGVGVGGNHCGFRAHKDFQLGWQSRASALSSRDLSKIIPLKGAGLCDFQRCRLLYLKSSQSLC